MEERKSGLFEYSLGIVIEDKPEGNDNIKVYPVEHIPQLSGLLKNTKLSYKTDMPDHKGVNRQETMDGGVDIVAGWINTGDCNRITSPDVYAGETIMIYRMADAPDYYWDTVFREPSVRRQETVNYGYSNLKTPDGSAFNKDTSYWLEWDTRRKRVQIHTANNDGEPFKWDLIFDTGNGSFAIQDDAQNMFQIDSQNNIITLTSVAGAIIVMDNGHITVHGKTIKMVGDESIEMDAPTVTINGVTTQNGNYTVNGDTALDGALSISGETALNGGMAGKGGATFEGDVSTSGGNVNMSGDVTMTGGSITANGKELG